MSLVKYEVLLNALEYGSITAAAEKMGYTQSGVSHLINSLEKELGVKLIIRGRNGVRPTPVGESLMPYIRRINNDLWEKRPIRDRIFFFCFKDEKIVLLHYFIKKTNKTPRREIEKAINEMNNYIRGEI